MTTTLVRFMDADGDDAQVGEVETTTVPRTGDVVNVCSDEPDEGPTAYVVEDVQWSLGGPLGRLVAWANVVELDKSVADEEAALEARDRIESVVAFLLAMAWAAIRRPRMHAASLDEAERVVVHCLHVRAQLLGLDHPDWRHWLAAQYPTVPGEVRTVATAVKQLFPEDKHHENFVAEMTRALAELHCLTPPTKEEG